jgi:aminopeptidase N
MVTAFNRWRKYDTGRQALMRAELEGIRNTAQLSRDVREIVGKALA